MLIEREIEKYSLDWVKERMLNVPLRKLPYLYRAITIEELPEVRKFGLIPKKPRAFKGAKEDFKGIWLTEYDNLEAIFEIYFLPIARLGRAVLLKINTKNLDPNRFVIGINYPFEKGKIGVNEYLQWSGEIIYLDRISPQDIEIIDGPSGINIGKIMETRKNLKTILREELLKEYQGLSAPQIKYPLASIYNDFQYKNENKILNKKHFDIEFNPDNIILGKEFNDKYVEFKDKIISKVIYDFGSAGANMGEGTYWNITPWSEEHWLYEKEYEGHVVDLIHTEIKPNARIYVQNGITDIGIKTVDPNIFEIIAKNADGAYDPENDTYGLVIYNRNVLIQ